MSTAREGIVLELQQDCLDQKASTGTILRKAKVIASKLDLSDLKAWIDSELNGYDCSMNDLPEHRKGVGAPKFKNPYHGWCPIVVSDDQFGRVVRTAFMPQPVSELEEMAQSGNSDTLIMSYHPTVEGALQAQLPAPMECGLHFSKSQIKAALDFVRNKTLDWSLELEARGVIGEGYSFAAVQKKEAQIVTNYIYGGNIGVLGDVAGDASAAHFVSTTGVDVDRLNSFLGQAVPASAGLDPETRAKVQPLLNDLRQEAQGKPNPSKVKSCLQSLRAVLEEASGSLVASAILGALAT